VTGTGHILGGGSDLVGEGQLKEDPVFDTTVWIAEAFLAFFFLMAGLPKIGGRGLDRWVGFDRVPRPMTIVIGACEIAAAVGLVVPLLTDEGQWTTPLAAVGIAVISLMASGFHIRNREWLAALETALWASIAGSIAAARWGEFATGPAIARQDVLMPLLIGLVIAVVANLVVLTRRQAPASLADR
jgi:uncharacterized membrane protein YphA (DoxX/SURF4 family)